MASQDASNLYTVVQPQEAVTYVSNVEVLVTRIEIFNWQIYPSLLDRSLLKVLIYRSSKGKDPEFQSEQDCDTGIKNLLYSKGTNTLCYGKTTFISEM